MKKKILIPLIFITTLMAFTSCESVPRDRPTILQDQNNVTTVDPDPDVKVAEITRPSGAVILQPGQCGCQAGEPITLGDCAAVCSNKQASSDNRELLFFDVELTEAITLDTYEDLNGWCTKPLINPDTQEQTELNASCNMEVKDESGSLLTLDFNPVAGTTSFALDISALADDKTYRLTVVESASAARSTTFQLRKFSSLISSNMSGPLQLMPINRYTCMIRNGGATSQTQDNIERFHLYFNSVTRPEPLRESTVGSFFCHDIDTFGTTPINSPLLEETTGMFSLWFKDDPRFFDLDSNTREDVNQLIEQEVILQGSALSAPLDIFSSLTWMSAFDDGDVSPGQASDAASVTVVNSELGYYMNPFMDEQTYKAYCPTRAHYFSTSPLFSAMREIISVDTEGLYLAKQDNVCDFLLVNETIMNKIWFYKEGGNHIQPTTNTIQGKQIQFYWPADVASPYIKKSHQRIYTIKTTSELGGSCGSTVTTGQASNASGVRTSILPHDKRIGCIPVMGN